MGAEVAGAGEVHAQVDVLVAFGFGVGVQAHLLAGEPVGDIALTAGAGGMEQAALQGHAHIAADVGSRGVPAGEGIGQPPLRAVIIKAKGMVM